ncbi:hypothetical protein [Pseudomonas aeruginosa]|nr:hypothetical protein [Pseudomonas aeruginosa]MBO8406759.1 hypothetical protein [Pseudomonas aeruginosa]
MSDAEYNEIAALPLAALRTLNCWKLARYMTRCGHVQRAMILQAIAA